MMTKTKLYALDLRSFTATIEQLGEQLRANQEKLDDIAHAKETIASGMQGQSAQAMIAKLDALEQKINDHITSIQETQAVITTYRTNKQQLQREVIDYVDSVELDGFSVSNVWVIFPSDTMLAALSPLCIGGKFIAAGIMQQRLVALVETFVRYDLQAAVHSGSDVKPYTTSGGFSTIEPDRTIEWDDDFPTVLKQAKTLRKTGTTGTSGSCTVKEQAGSCNTPTHMISTDIFGKIQVLPRPSTTKRLTWTMPSSETTSTQTSMRHCRLQMRQ